MFVPRIINNNLKLAKLFVFESSAVYYRNPGFRLLVLFDQLIFMSR